MEADIFKTCPHVTAELINWLRRMLGPIRRAEGRVRAQPWRYCQPLQCTRVQFLLDLSPRGVLGRLVGHSVEREREPQRRMDR